MTNSESKIRGCLYGMAVGDAMGMPPELWGRDRIRQEYGYIEDFLDGNPKNAVSYQYRCGNFTDDTAQALILLDSLKDTGFVPDRKDMAEKLLAWAIREDAFRKNILGPTSKAVLDCYQTGKDPRPFSDAAVTNGAAMRIAPIGLLFPPDQKEALCRYVADVSAVTHSSDIACSGASMVAMAVSAAAAGMNREEVMEIVLGIEQYARTLGASTCAPSVGRRLRWGIETAAKYKDDPTAFSDALYWMIGAGHDVSESVPCALAIAYYTWDVKKCAILCANLGGDTDTIGAMACAICGAARGIESIPDTYIKLIDQANPVCLEDYVQLILARGEE